MELQRCSVVGCERYSLTPYPASDHYFPYHDAGCALVVVMSKVLL